MLLILKITIKTFIMRLIIWIVLLSTQGEVPNCLVPKVNVNISLQVEA